MSIFPAIAQPRGLQPQYRSFDFENQFLPTTQSLGVPGSNLEHNAHFRVSESCVLEGENRIVCPRLLGATTKMQLVGGVKKASCESRKKNSWIQMTPVGCSIAHRTSSLQRLWRLMGATRAQIIVAEARLLWRTKGPEHTQLTSKSLRRWRAREGTA